MDPREGRSEQLPRHMIEGIERNDRVKRLRLELERGEVGPHEFGLRHRGTGAAQLFRRGVDARHLETRGKALCVGHTCTATELEHPCPVMQPRHELFRPLAARIADDPIAPLGETLAHRVVATTDELYPRISHSTITSPSLGRSTGDLPARASSGAIRERWRRRPPPPLCAS